MARAKKTEQNQPARDIGHEIWGIVYLALGVLTLISLGSRYVGRPEVLGPIFGTRLSQGLFVLFGPVAVLLVPAGILAAGWRQMRGRRITPWELATWSALTFEMAALLAVHNIRYIEHGAFPFTSNYLGNALIYLLHYVFGPHPLGPYLILSAAFVISILLAFRIDAPLFFGTLLRLAKAAFGWVRLLLTRIAHRSAPAAPRISRPRPPPNDRAPRRPAPKRNRRNVVWRRSWPRSGHARISRLP
jgi:hypothetical protein